MIGSGLASGAFGQGIVNLENAFGNGMVTINGSPAPAGSYQVALLWFNGGSFQQVGAVYQTASGNGDGLGYFFGENVIIPNYSPTGTFMVEGWTGDFASYAAALTAGGTNVAGLTASFASPEGNLLNDPPDAAANLSGPNTQTGPGGWDGNLPLEAVPEPSTIVLGGLGALGLWLFRRRQ